MQRMILWTLAGCMIAGAAATARAQGPPEGRRGPQPPQRQFEPMRLFERLDADETGAIVLDKLPERLPEPLKQMLTKADADEDGTLTREEFKAAVEVARERFAERRKEAIAKGRPARPDRKPESEGRPSRDHRPQAKGCPAGKAGPPRRPGAGPGRPPMPDLKSVFGRMDRDDSGELSLEEFTEGMRRLHAYMMHRHAQARPSMGFHGRPPMGPHARGPAGPPSWHRGPGHRPGPPSWHRGPGRRPGPPSWHRGPGRPSRGPDAKRAEPKKEKDDAKPERSRKPRGEKPAEKDTEA